MAGLNCLIDRLLQEGLKSSGTDVLNGRINSGGTEE